MRSSSVSRVLRVTASTARGPQPTLYWLESWRYSIYILSAKMARSKVKSTPSNSKRGDHNYNVLSRIDQANEEICGNSADVNRENEDLNDKSNFRRRNSER